MDIRVIGLITHPAYVLARHIKLLTKEMLL
jgi:hypothetical protein